MPSQAMTINSRSSVTSLTWTSGYAVTICSCCDFLSLRLKTKSPSALDRARLPFTRLNSTQPPAATIRLDSVSLEGLWSKDKASTRPPKEATARESPTLAWNGIHIRNIKWLMTCRQQSVSLSMTCQVNLVTIGLALMDYCIDRYSIQFCTSCMCSHVVGRACLQRLVTIISNHIVIICYDIE